MDLVTLLAAMLGARVSAFCPAMTVTPASVIVSPGASGSVLVSSGCGHAVTVACPTGIAVVGPGATWIAGDVVTVALVPGYENAGQHGACHVNSLEGMATIDFVVGA